MRRTGTWMMLFALGAWVALAAHPAFAQDQADDELGQEQQQIDESAKAGQSVVRERLKSRFGVDDQRIQDLRAQHMGYGEIATTLSLAEHMDGGINDENIQSIVDMRTGENKTGWGNIARQNGLTVGELKRNLRGVSASAADAAPQKTTRPDKMDRDARGTSKDITGQTGHRATPDAGARGSSQRHGPAVTAGGGAAAGKPGRGPKW